MSNDYHLKPLDCVIIPKDKLLFRCYGPDRDLENAVLGNYFMGLFS